MTELTHGEIAARVRLLKWRQAKIDAHLAEAALEAAADQNFHELSASGVNAAALVEKHQAAQKALAAASLTSGTPGKDDQGLVERVKTEHQRAAAHRANAVYDGPAAGRARQDAERAQIEAESRAAAMTRAARFGENTAPIATPAFLRPEAADLFDTETEEDAAEEQEVAPPVAAGKK